MGRTNPTYRALLEAIETRWGAYRRALRRRDQPAFDRLFEHAHAHADAASHLNAEDPLWPAVVSMLLEHERRLSALERQLESSPSDGEATDVGADGE